MLEVNNIVVRSQDVLFSGIEEETVLLSITNSNYYGMDSVASRIWELLAEPILINSLIEQLLTEFEVPKEECENDVIEFLDTLKQQGLLVVKNG